MARNFNRYMRSRNNTWIDMQRGTPANGIWLYFFFALAGATGFVVDGTILTAGVALGLTPGLARVPSFLAAVATTWIMNRSFTFRTAKRASWAEFMQYLFAMSFGLAVNYAVFLAVIWAWDLARDWPVIALVPATLAGMILNFITSRLILSR